MAIVICYIRYTMMDGQTVRRATQGIVDAGRSLHALKPRMFTRSYYKGQLA